VIEEQMSTSTPGGPHQYSLRLFITGMTARSSRAVENVRTMCEELLPGRYELHVVDVYQQPGLASREQIIVAPTLIKKHPLPQRRIIGDMSDRDRLVQGLSLHDRS
jgi:circadian clock protein KaiB